VEHSPTIGHTGRVVGSQLGGKKFDELADFFQRIASRGHHRRQGDDVPPRPPTAGSETVDLDDASTQDRLSAVDG